MKYIVYSVLFITLLSCNKKEENKPIQKIEKEYIDDPLVYEVINAVLEMPEITEDNPEYLLNFANPFLFDLGMEGEDFYFHAEKYFGKIDTVLINNQIKESRYSFYQKDKINNIEVIDYNFIYAITNNKLDSLNQSIKKFKPNISVSFPIFNQDKNVAFISYYYNCGFLCGIGKQMFLKKVGNQWKVLIVYNEIIS